MRKEAGVDLFGAIGRGVIAILREIGRLATLAGRTLADIVRPPVRAHLTVVQMERLGIQSLPIILLAGAFTGAAVTHESAFAAAYFGAEGMVSGSVGVALTRELAPTLTGLLFAGRGGSAMAAELGTMRISEQIDALTTMAVDPVNYLVKPRVVAATLVAPLLTIVFDAIGIAGSWAVSMFTLHMSRPEFFVRLQDWVDWVDVWAGLAKAMIFGFLVAVIGCSRGLYARGGAAGVGRATTSAVVVASVAILVANYFVALWLPQ